ncbi:MAG: adenylosuccinate lyase [Halanaeroarchaeum sp.]
MPPSRDSLDAVTPLDGRYADRTAPLVPYASEGALLRARVRVEVEYLLSLADLEAIPLALDASDRETLRALHEDFDDGDAALIKRIETEGARGYDATNHDVKAVEYFVREATPERIHPWIHFGLTSEDVNNLAYRLLVRPAMREVLLPELRAIRDELVGMAHDHADLPMLARTHGQPATPTTFGKEMAVFASRLGRAIVRVEEAVDGLQGKLGGASGTLAAHVAAVPDVDWRAFAREFVADLGLDFVSPTTQINPSDDLATLFSALQGTNRILLDLDRDVWRYVSDGYLGQSADAGETGSSTMPHKVNPIDFENSEGNLSKANSDLGFLADSLTTSRLQRDLSDSTVKRNVGAALGYCLVGYQKLAAGLETIVPAAAVMRRDLEENPEVVGEAVQTILRREGRADAYERVKELSRGRRVDLEDFRDLFEDLDVSPAVREELGALTPATYTGVAADLARDVE